MTHPIELATARILAELRQNHRPDNTDANLTVVPGAYFSWDATNGDLTLEVSPETGILMRIKGQVRKTPEWLSFNLELREGTFAVGDVLGLVVALDGCAGEEMVMFVRSGRDGDMQDTYLQDSLTGSAGRSVQTLMHQVRAEDAMAGNAAFHTLVVNLPRRDFELELRDICAFVVPAARGLTLGAPTIS